MSEERFSAIERRLDSHLACCNGGKKGSPLLTVIAPIVSLASAVVAGLAYYTTLARAETADLKNEVRAVRVDMLGYATVARQDQEKLANNFSAAISGIRGEVSDYATIARADLKDAESRVLADLVSVRNLASSAVEQSHNQEVVLAGYRERMRLIEVQHKSITRTRGLQAAYIDRDINSLWLQTFGTQRQTLNILDLGTEVDSDVGNGNGNH